MLDSTGCWEISAKRWLSVLFVVLILCSWWNNWTPFGLQKLPQDFPAVIMKPLKITPSYQAGVLYSSNHLLRAKGTRERGSFTEQFLLSLPLMHVWNFTFLVEDGFGAQTAADTTSWAYRACVCWQILPLFLNNTRIGILALPVH